jgi:hypothetical protein
VVGFWLTCNHFNSPVTTVPSVRDLWYSCLELELDRQSLAMVGDFTTAAKRGTKVVFGLSDWTFGVVVGFWLACDLGGEGRVRSPS